MEPLIESGFLTLASNVLATCKQDASLEKEKEKEKEKKKGASQNPNLSLREMALGIIQEAVIPSSVALEEIVSKSIQAYGKDMELTDEDAATWILERVREYRAAGKRVTRFWFENGGYLPDLKPAEKQKYSVADEMRRQLGIVQ